MVLKVNNSHSYIVCILTKSLFLKKNFRYVYSILSHFTHLAEKFTSFQQNTKCKKIVTTILFHNIFKLFCEENWVHGIIVCVYVYVCAFTCMCACVCMLAYMHARTCITSTLYECHGTGGIAQYSSSSLCNHDPYAFLGLC